MLRVLAAVVVVFLLVDVASAAETLKLGGQAPDWSDLKGTDGKAYALGDFADKDVLVIVFTCNSCGYAQDYEQRILKLAKSHCGQNQKAALVAINPNKIAEDLPEQMKKRAEAKGYTFPYVWDETQATAKAYGARWTPEFYVFNKQRKLVYHGALDDDNDAEKAKVNYVAEAIEAALAGQTPKVQEEPARGCAVRYERPKRTRNK
jgi:peroxiredoxin